MTESADAPLTLYGCPNTRSLRAAWALEEAGAEYAYVPVALLKGEGRKPAYLRVNPGGKVPALTVGDTVLTESAAIVTWVGDRYPGSGLTPPAGTLERARHDQWCAFAVAELEQPLWTIAKHRFALPRERRLPAIEETAVREFGLACRVLAHGLKDQTHIFGQRFDGADILLAHTLAWARSARVPVLPESLLEYADRCLARPAAARAMQREAAAPEASASI
ncbi:MAG: glutathione S-transferase family protein [Pseudomonadota bacterium]